MRSETEMFDLILSIAKNDERVRAVVLNGSRVNPNARKDPFQDYDVVYYVREVAPFRGNKDFIRPFGELMILQTPEDMGDPPADNNGRYTYLMQFLDGNRIDLSLAPLERIASVADDSLAVVLLDKDGLIPELPAPSDRVYLPEKPTARQFNDCCNEFWWVSTYVAKGLWRDELPYTREMLDCVVREEMLKMLTWYYGTQTDFQKSPGKLGKYFKQCLAPELWALLESTYADYEAEHIWDSLFAMGDLFRQTARSVAAYCGYEYPEQDDRNVTAHLHHVRTLPRNAKVMYP
jgi:aminoglycoside 6-adenylyltransferase